MKWIMFSEDHMRTLKKTIMFSEDHKDLKDEKGSFKLGYKIFTFELKLMLFYKNIEILCKKF